jgi:formylglycine-generating enzyme required for sulfatase activity
VGSFPANTFGLHDMHGNVWEWTQDCWNDNYNGAPTDGTAWEKGECSQRVLRVSSWNSSAEGLRSAARGASSRGDRRNYLGFRLARDAR